MSKRNNVIILILVILSNMTSAFFMFKEAVFIMPRLISAIPLFFGFLNITAVIMNHISLYKILSND